MINNITPDYLNIVDIARHCDLNKLKIAETNALDYDLTPIICDIECYFTDVDIKADDAVYVGGQIGLFPFGGLNKISALYSYARYVENSIYNDTGAGFVRKDHGNSFPIQMSEMKDIAKQHRAMARAEVDRLKAYVCSNSRCSCICDGSLCDKNKVNTRLTGNKGRNVIRTRNRY